jgi:hypothetical protein
VIEPFIKDIRILINNIPGNLVPKIQYLVNSILEITLKNSEVCCINYEFIPKFLAYEDNELYTKFLKLSRNNDACQEFYKNIAGNVYDEFLYISLAFITYLFCEINNTELLVYLETDDRLIKIFRKDCDDQKIHATETAGSIKLNITTH